MSNPWDRHGENNLSHADTSASQTNGVEPPTASPKEPDRLNFLPYFKGDGTDPNNWVAPKWMAAMGVPGDVAAGKPVSLEDVTNLAGFAVGGRAPIPPTGMSRTMASRIPFTKANAEEGARNVQSKLVGGDENLKTLYEMNAAAPPSAIPGYTRGLSATLSESPLSTGLASKGQNIGRREGLSYRAEQQRELNLNAITAYLESKGMQSPANLTKAESVRTAHGAENYPAAYREPPVNSLALEDALSSPTGRDASRDAIKAAENAQRPFMIGEPGNATVRYPIEALHQVEKIAQENVNKAYARGEAVGPRDMAKARTRIVDEITKLSKGLREANEVFTGDSIPINQTRLMRDLTEKFDGPSLAAANEATETALTTAATDGHASTFAQVLTPQQIEAVNLVLQEKALARKAVERASGTASAPDRTSPLARVVKGTMAMTPETVAVKRGADVAGATHSNRIAKALLEQELNPRKFVSPWTPSVAARMTRNFDRQPTYGFALQSNTNRPDLRDAES